MVEPGDVLEIIPGRTNPSFDSVLVTVESVEDGVVRAYTNQSAWFAAERQYIRLVPGMYVKVGRRSVAMPA